MLIIGEITDINEGMVQLTSSDFDFVTPYLYIPQKFTLNGKSGFNLELGALAAAILTDDMTEGVFLGQLYNGVDTSPDNMSDCDFIQFPDGSSISHQAGSNTFEMNVETLKVSGDIISGGNVSDSTSSMQDMRDIYNSHTNPNGGVVAEKME
ncbi:MAG: hypothetical protein LUE64_04405 [Candidatus Gastranaerophilales bacterium]|nr:hypothetical protein [Candidatus Gastranaerophilales bacterium]